MEKKLKATITVLITLLFGAYIAMLKIVDVRPIGPAGTAVGMATVNGWVQNMLTKLTGLLPVTPEMWDKLSDLSLLAAFAVAASFGLVGLIQLIRRRSLLKVSREIIGLAIAYVMAGIVYIVFEIFVVNYRPVLEAGQTFPEASFPSSHTVLAFVILATAIIAWGHLLENHSAIERLLQTAAVLLLIFAVGVRTLSGVHWLTDIVGGVLAGCAITSLYSTLITEPGK